MTDTITRIREKCIEANPEIVELKDGCVLRIKGDARLYTPSYDLKESYQGKGVVDEISEGCGCCSYAETYRPDEYTIVGRPIRLADVLLAIEKTSYPRSFWFRETSSLKDGQLHLSCEEPLGHLVWNLREDDLEKQSPETVDFIAKLLGV